MSGLSALGSNLRIQFNLALNTLEAYCGLFNLLNSNRNKTYTVAENGIDPDRSEIVGSNGSCYVAPIPSMGQWGLIVCGLLVVTLGIIGIRYNYTNRMSSTKTTQN